MKPEEQGHQHDHATKSSLRSELICPNWERLVESTLRLAVTSHASPDDLPLRETVTQVQASAEQLGHPPRETDRSPCRGRCHLVGASQRAVVCLGVKLAVRNKTVCMSSLCIQSALEGSISADEQGR